MIPMLKLYGSYDVKPDKLTLKRMGELEIQKYLSGQELIESGRYSKGMQVDGRFMTMTEGAAMLTFLRWRDRFENTTDEWLGSLDHFLHVLKEGRKWRKPKR